MVEANQEMARVYRILGDWVKIIISDYLAGEWRLSWLQLDGDPSSRLKRQFHALVPSCVEDPNCIYDPRLNPSGIPYYKLFIWDAFGSDEGGHRYGREWHLTFFPSTTYTYVGLTLEYLCREIEFIPVKDRPRRAYILGKDRLYFQKTIEHDEATFSSWDTVTEETGISFVMGTIQRGSPDAPPLPEGILDIGSQTRSNFMMEISKSRALVGIGHPRESSSPLEALCVGVPFINPLMNHEWDPAGDRIHWWAQHKYLVDFDPPYVYNVPAGNHTAFVQALKEIDNHPLEDRYIPSE